MPTSFNWNQTGSSLIVSDSSYLISTSIVQEAETPSGTKIMMKFGKKQIHPRLYFKFVKSKLKETSLESVNRRMLDIQKLLKNFEVMGQDAPFDLLISELFKLTKHAEAVGSGYDKAVEKKDIQKFIGLVNADKKIVKYEDFSNFPRPVPKASQKKILEAKAKGIFDNFKILFLDYSNEDLKTNKQKIVEKDPIVFGVFKEDPDKHFFITDWVDEVCDLTLMQFVDKIREKEKLYDFLSNEELDKAFVDRVKEEYLTKKKRLEETNSSNYKIKEKEEEVERLKKELASYKNKKSWWKLF